MEYVPPELQQKLTNLQNKRKTAVETVGENKLVSTVELLDEFCEEHSINYVQLDAVISYYLLAKRLPSL